ncbi:beta-ketoacyl-[acyl-carrier-protein] synthase family protein [uncultured Desulfobacter sp.]|uniref:beta-ketoacyl-[acyl-carrier-protein] synthase family protein n=1 Tax=uncultured Desulfobacter sp. TaxID=240139 RepID=UPI002AAA8D20|nr:beta-ketoacyl-[acyl-carrier-protein] synthase family protein [uncultured Desulfobacter sp.]
MNRVVITGLGIISPIGNTAHEIWQSLIHNTSGIAPVPEWEQVKDLKVRLAGSCKDYNAKRILRKDRRTMGPMTVMAGLCALDALDQAGISPELMRSKEAGISIGSTTGSGNIIQQMFDDLKQTGGISRLEGTAFMKIMNHSVAANLAAMLGTSGRVIAPCAACATSTQAIGMGFETIRNGLQKIMICGGADELHLSTAGVFDVLNAASRQTSPERTPRPFDRDRDGLVVAEGAGAVILEDLDHALARNANILAEVIGFHTCCDGSHMTSPQDQGMLACMQGAMASSGCRLEEIDYINAHATGTLLGDAAEARAIAMLGTHNIPVSATKGFTGHTLAASGVMEAIFCLKMMEHNTLIPTKNLATVAPECEGITHILAPLEKEVNVIMTSNFAFGGINATLILKRYS